MIIFIFQPFTIENVLSLVLYQPILEDNSIAPKIMKAIEMLKGVTSISLYKKQEEATSAPSATHSPRIQRLRGIAKGITKQQIKDDDRLAYLLNK